MEEDKYLAFLISGCQRMDEHSQMELYRYFYSYGMGICLRYARNRESAREMLNDGFLKVFTKIDQYDAEFPFKPWLRKVLVHAAIDHFRRYERQLFDSRELSETTVSTIHNDALDQLEFEDLLHIMQQLPAAYRMVFNLYVVDQLSHKEIAAQLNISVGTSKSNLAKARQKIKELLSEMHGMDLKSKKYGQ
jgi:RNA polymerase sigma-70 factor (ECF subfamily)